MLSKREEEIVNLAFEAVTQFDNPTEWFMSFYDNGMAVEDEFTPDERVAARLMFNYAQSYLRPAQRANGAYR